MRGVKKEAPSAPLSPASAELPTTAAARAASGSGSKKRPVGGMTGNAGAGVGAGAGAGAASPGKGPRPDRLTASWVEHVEAGQKRARRPPARFELPLDSREELLVHQAIENSKIETHLCHEGVGEIPEVPVYRPTPEEFADPIRYIEGIRAEGERFGVVKVIPPDGWAPPADALDLGLPRPFKTRLQSLRFFKEGTGFADGKEYTFAQYEAMAHAFRDAWVEGRYASRGKPAPTLEELERDYWRIIEAAEEDVDVEYGNDLDTMTYGSGFPRPPGLLVKEGQGQEEEEESFDVATVGARGKGRSMAERDYYARCGWNLNNLPLWPGSVLRCIHVPLKGVNVPWLYMGMLFATFCWHNEDNFMYSLNYLHRGAPKQWYTVPGAKADAMEKVMRGFLRDTFQKVPDLLHHMTTHFNPMLFHRANVPVYRTVQEPGQFIVTFPKSLHAGFSYGFNCAEAVNFSPPAWLPQGREAVERYRRFGRNPVFSHERLVLTLASNLSPEWSVASLRALRDDLALIVREEEWRRRELEKQGLRVDVVDRSKLFPNNLAHMDGLSLDYDEKRVCLSCRHVCFLSAVACECDGVKVACLREVGALCGCDMSQRYLMAWHDIDELWDLVKKVEDSLGARQAKEAVAAAAAAVGGDAAGGSGKSKGKAAGKVKVEAGAAAAACATKEEKSGEEEGTTSEGTD